MALKPPESPSVAPGSAQTTPPAISVERLQKSYSGRAVVRDLSFDVRRGEIFALLGPNGAGKTTTIEILEGYRVPDGGQARVLGLDPQRDGAKLRPRIGLMLQNGGFYPAATSTEILRLYASFFHSSVSTTRHVPASAACRVGRSNACRLPSPWLVIRSWFF